MESSAKVRNAFNILLLLFALAPGAVLAMPTNHWLPRNDSERCLRDTPTFAADARPIVLPYWDWGSTKIVHQKYLTKMVTQVLRILIEDVLGTPVVLLDGIPAYNEMHDLNPDVWYPDLLMLQNGDYHIDLEVWGEYGPEGDEFFNNGTVVSAGPLGYIGAKGWYIPSYMLELDETLDSYGTYKFQEAAALFSASDTPYTDLWTALRALLSDEQNDIAKTAIDTTFEAEAACGAGATLPEEKRKCVEEAVAAYMNRTRGVNGLSAGVGLPKGVIYSPGVDWGAYEEAIVQNLGLYLDVNSLTTDDTIFATMMRERVAAQQAFLTHWYSPHAIFGGAGALNLTRVGLPDPSDACEEMIRTQDIANYNCDYPRTLLFKIVSQEVRRFWPKVYYLTNQFALRLTDINDMLAAVDTGGTEYEAACGWVKAKQAVWERFMPARVDGCPPGTTMGLDPDGNEICAQCQENTYNRIKNGKCIPCPSGAICPGGEEIMVQEQYWIDPQSDYTFPILYLCQTAHCCSGNCTMERQCADGFGGTLCSECKDGYYEWNDECVSCDQGANWGVLALIALFVIGDTIVFTLWVPEDTLFWHDVLLYFQIASYLMDYRRSDVTSGLDFLNLEVNKAVYTTSNSFQQVCSALFVTGEKHYDTSDSFHNLGAARAQSRDLEQKIEEIWAGRVLAIVIATYMPVVHPAINTFSCRAIGSTQVMRDLPMIECWGHEHLGLLIWGGAVFLIWVVIFPLLVGGLLRYTIRTIVQNAKQIDQDGESTGKVLKGLYVLYHGYKPAYYYWLIPDLFFRVAVAMAASLTERTSVFHALSIVLIIWVYAMLNYAFKPARHQFDNYSRRVMYISLIALGVCQVLPYEESTSIFGLVATYMFLAVPAALAPIFFVVEGARTVNSWEDGGEAGKGIKGRISRLPVVRKLRGLADHWADEEHKRANVVEFSLARLPKTKSVNNIAGSGYVHGSVASISPGGQLKRFNSNVILGENGVGIMRSQVLVTSEMEAYRSKWTIDEDTGYLQVLGRSSVTRGHGRSSGDIGGRPRTLSTEMGRPRTLSTEVISPNIGGERSRSKLSEMSRPRVMSDIQGGNVHRKAPASPRHLRRNLD
ncbi:hypothetical protein HK097_009337 [Rhizophlyctis rosea]|uniref:ABC-type glycine betaine transport system substrate-binding domain-containing protein n=1 Tax=Rhizophlyctis rosea TaxID=64517 RepID=A0AAD5S930_9FUNG|nr:hypothetical protein HK097_009337 [Rhizophlyctis rosea]